MTQKWCPGVSYGHGSKVVYNGIVYRIIQPHTSQSDWTPNVVPALWGAVGPDDEDSYVVVPPQIPSGNEHQYQQNIPQVAPAHPTPYNPPSEQGQQQPWQVQPEHLQHGYNPVPPAQPASEYQPPSADYKPPPTQEPAPSYEEPEKKNDYSNALKIGAGILGGALALGAVGLGAYGISQHLKRKKNKREWEQDALRSYETGNTPVYWVMTKNAEVPENAIIGGSETNGKNYYISRFWHDQGLYLGKVDTINVGGAAFGIDGGEHYLKEYEILVGNPMSVKWVDVAGSVETAIYERGLKCVEGGHTREGKEIYVVQAEFEGNWIPGYAVDGVAHCGYNGQEKTRLDYKVLVYE